MSSSRFPSLPSQLRSVRLPSSDRSLWAPNRHVGMCSGRLSSAGTLHLCYNRVDPSQLTSGRCLSIRSRPFDLSLLPDGWSRLVSNSLIWGAFQSTAFSLMLLGSSGPANARYLSVGTTPALIKLCGLIYRLHVSDMSNSAAVIHEHITLYRYGSSNQVPHMCSYATMKS